MLSRFKTGAKRFAQKVGHEILHQFQKGVDEANEASSLKSRNWNLLLGAAFGISIVTGNIAIFIATYAATLIMPPLARSIWGLGKGIYKASKEAIAGPVFVAKAKINIKASQRTMTDTTAQLLLSSLQSQRAQTLATAPSITKPLRVELQQKATDFSERRAKRMQHGLFPIPYVPESEITPSPSPHRLR